MRVLHITNWYPTVNSPLNGIFIKEHIDALHIYGVQSKVYHVNFSKGPNCLSFKKEILQTSIVVSHPFLAWFLCEIFSSIIIFLILIKNANKYDILNFHIAYPNLVYWKHLKKISRTPIVCIEHWSAYGQNFGLSKNEKANRKLKKVKAIFNEKILFLFVSSHLLNQVQIFADIKISRFGILPNVVSDFFSFKKEVEYNELQFLSAAVWRKGKRPIEMIQGFYRFSRNHPKSKLIIAGDGELLSDMEICIHKLGAKNIYLIGSITKIEISKILDKSCALCHSSEHETFSVICAEALVSGRPVIVNELPAVNELIDESNSIKVHELNTESWEAAFNLYYSARHKFDRMKIAMRAAEKFSKIAIGEKYKEFLISACEKAY